MALAIFVISSGCASSHLDHARREYYQGNPQNGLILLDENKVSDRDRILFLMERGTLYQAASQYEESVRDFNEANDLLEQSETLSVSRGATSMVINDNVLLFRGYPFERTYLHVMAALSYLGTGNWQDSAVEARRIINTLNPEEVGEYPQDAFAHYVAGLCLELVGDLSNARVRYRKASEFSSAVSVSDSGHLVLIGEESGESVVTIVKPKNGQAELILFMLLGRVADYSTTRPTQSVDTSPYAEIRHEGKVLGRTYTLTDTRHLAAISEKRLATMKAAKTVGRIAAKRAISHEIEKENELLGSLVWLVLLALEQPDFRHWETLPRYLQAARVSCPSALDHFDLIIRSPNGDAIRNIRIDGPIQGKSPLFISFIRDFKSN